jgi:hypothetical protein
LNLFFWAARSIARHVRNPKSSNLIWIFPGDVAGVKKVLVALCKWSMVIGVRAFQIPTFSEGITYGAWGGAALLPKHHRTNPFKF